MEEEIREGEERKKMGEEKERDWEIGVCGLGGQSNKAGGGDGHRLVEDDGRSKS